MSHNLNRDFFDDFLREATENFSMIPSRRVWFSIYNNLHPSKKLPSFGTTLIIFCCLLFIGTPHHFAFIGQEIKSVPNVATRNIEKFASPQSTSSSFVAKIENPKKPLPCCNEKMRTFCSSINYPKLPIKSFSTPITNFNNEEKNSLNRKADHSTDLSDKIDANAIHLTENVNEFATKEIGVSAPISPSETTNKEREQTSITESTNIKSGNYSFQFYATPSYGYRSMIRITEEVLTPNSFIGNAGPIEETFSFHHTPSFNLEAGGSILLPLNRDFRVKAGMQFNYTNYKIQGDQLPYSFYANMQVISPSGFSMLESHPTHVANSSNINPGANVFNNSSFQISLPIGTDFKLLGNKDWEWFAGATIQPSYVMGNNPYLISADMKSYINDPSFVRRWNVNTSFETFLTYRLKNGAMLNAGPQFRYQLFSTYESRYLYSEKLYNIGIKLGLTRDF